MTPINKTPVLLLTGFLGSGKTTLLRALLSGTETSDTAIVVNEFGEVGLDHHLLVGGSENMVVLENGCVCCSMRDDLEACLEDLFWGRMRREIPAFSRVVIETTGLADPSQVQRIIGTQSLAAERFHWASVAATVDGVMGLWALQEFGESLLQAGRADHLIITKVDLASEKELSELEGRLRTLNPHAAVHHANLGVMEAPLETLFTPARSHDEWLRDFPGEHASSGEAHPTDVVSVWLELAKPISRNRFETAFASVIEQFGTSLLRAKGILRFTGHPHPMICQYVGGGHLELEDHAPTDGKHLVPGLVVMAAGITEDTLADRLMRNGLGLVPRERSHHRHSRGSHP